MLVIILIVLQVMDTFLLFRLMKKGSFVTVPVSYTHLTLPTIA